MLGTNDTKIQFNRSAADITEGMKRLVHIVKASDKGPNEKPPKILIMAPPPTFKIANPPPQGNAISNKTTEQLAALYQQLAMEEGCDFFDVGLIVKASKMDGVHLDEASCEHLGHAMYEKVRTILV